MAIAEDVKAKCESSLEATHVECVDFSDDHCDGAKLELVVVSAVFQGLPLLKRHRKVNEVLADFMPQIHALTIKAWTPEQYQEKEQQAK
mmetsp:Transcript_15236/g.28923  ORF Transcript_15236/g.28923 Transcript_15236/m.28923 type:complete len:89 (-) Transcript_15236:58-324(-)